jgi:tetratricopeptide (TPR) repeat protein
VSADVSRLEALRRRVEEDPASIAFAQLAEELRRAGRYREAISVSRAGLTKHREYLSARVTLGRALIEVNDLDAAQAELERVLRGAPENLAAIRGLAEIHHRRDDLPRALVQYRAALALAPNDPELQKKIAALSQSESQTTGPELADSGTLPDGPSGAARPPDARLLDGGLPPSGRGPALDERRLTSAPPERQSASVLAFPAVAPPAHVGDHEDAEQPTRQGSRPDARHSPERRRAERTLAALEKWLTAIEHPQVKDPVQT